jgi:hypothetical protein
LARLSDVERERLIAGLTATLGGGKKQEGHGERD